MQYRRADVTGGTYFFTVNLAQRQRTLLIDEIDVLRNVMRKVKKQHPFKIDAMVVLPDHMHTMMTLPANDKDYPVRWMLIKAGFSREMLKEEARNESRKRKGERGIWQRRYWEHLIRDNRDYERHVDYMHYNPVKHGYASKAADWQYSSIHQYIAQGTINRDWGDTEACSGTLEFGER